MRSFIVMAMFTASLAHAGWSDYEEVRVLEVDATGVSDFFIDAGAGSMTVNGDAGASTIQVTATIQVDEDEEDKAREIIANSLTLSLERNGDRIVLKSFFDGGHWGGNDGSVKLEVLMPAGIPLRVDDGSGSITIEDVYSNVEIDDGSGSLKIYNAGAIKIDDGSGSIHIENASGDVDIIDGSGSITVSGVGGSVTIDDGSGSINVRDVEKDLIILEDGSGGLSVSNVRGSVEQGT
jgi:DUF4097 and DUF4098 domain-containing protein YvlB